MSEPWPLETVPDLDLGEGHFLSFTRWAPDDLPANRERFGVPLPVVEKWGAIIRHYKPNGKMCEGCITFDGPMQQKWGGNVARWTVESWEPLTCSPSLLCMCGDHGFIRQGKWVKA